MSLTIPAAIMQSLVYTNGMFLTSDNMNTEQAYFNNWLYLQNQCMFTPGVFGGGLQVTQVGNSLQVSAGVGIDGAGHLLVVSSDATPVTMPATLNGPFYVYAQYPGTGTPIAAASPVLSYTAQVVADVAVPSGAVQLASGTASANAISGVTSNSVPPNLQAELLGASLNSMSQTMRGSVTVDGSGMQTAGSSANVTVPFPTSAPPFSSVPLVTATIQGSIPYAVAIASGTTQFVLTLTAVQNTAPPGGNMVVVNWTAVPNY